MIKPGDIVTRKSYGHDLMFKVVSVRRNRSETEVILKGLDMRLLADAPLNDLVIQNGSQVNRYLELQVSKRQHQIGHINAVHSQREKRKEVDTGQFRGEDFFEIPGRVLHLDGDLEYLQLCMETYSQLNIEASGFWVPERDQSRFLARSLHQYQVDILILTGHDSLIKESSDFRDLKNYRNSKYFVEAVRAARQAKPELDDLVIYAGACQSYYEALLQAGANFASSPHRVLIHALDPVYIAAKAAYCSLAKTIEVKEAVANTITGLEGIGGIETRGRLRVGYPRSPY